jgi:membrane-associated phospholipid phosphatase
MPEASVGMVRGRALLAGALLFLASFLTLTAIVTHHQFDSADRLARAVVHRPGSPLFLSAMEAASFLGGHVGQLTVICFGSLALSRRRRRVWGLSLPIVMAGAGLIQLVAKWAIDRPRPNLDPWGFPSAHVLSLVVLCGYVAYIIGTSRAGRSWGRLAAGVAVAVVATVAYSRMYLDAHWLSDVLGGLSMGLAYLLLVIWITRSTTTLWQVPVLRAVLTDLPSLELPDGSAISSLLAAPDGVAEAGANLPLVSSV